MKELGDCSAALPQPCLSRQPTSTLISTSMWGDFPQSCVLRAVGVSMPLCIHARPCVLWDSFHCAQGVAQKNLTLNHYLSRAEVKSTWFFFPLPWSSSFGVADSNTWGCHELTAFCAVRVISRAPEGLLRSWRRCCLQDSKSFAPASPKQLRLWVSSSCCHPTFAPSCRSCREWSKQGWGIQLVWKVASKRNFPWAWKTQLAELDRGACCVEERNLNWWKKTVFQMQDDKPSLQKVRMTRATFQEICTKHSTELQRQCSRGSTVIEKLSYLFKIMKPSPPCLLLTRSARIGCLWGHQDRCLTREISPLHTEACLLP